jgi:hypothetical protein
MKILLTACLLAVMSSVTSGAENWFHGTGPDKVAAKEAALATASDDLPLGVAFHVVEEHYVANSAVTSSSVGSVPPGYTCDLLVRHGEGIIVPKGVYVYHAHHKGTPTKGNSKKGSSSKGKVPKGKSSKGDSPKGDSSKGTSPNAALKTEKK